MTENVRLISFNELKQRGVPYTKKSLWRLEQEGRFPKRLNFGRRVAWVEAEIDEYLVHMVMQRDERTRVHNAQG